MVDTSLMGETLVNSRSLRYLISIVFKTIKDYYITFSGKYMFQHKYLQLVLIDIDVPRYAISNKSLKNKMWVHYEIE